MTDETTDHVLRTILSNSNDIQGEWVSKSELYVHPDAHAGMEPGEVQRGIHQL